VGGPHNLINKEEINIEEDILLIYYNPVLSNYRHLVNDFQDGQSENVYEIK